MKAQTFISINEQADSLRKIASDINRDGFEINKKNQARFLKYFPSDFNTFNLLYGQIGSPLEKNVEFHLFEILDNITYNREELLEKLINVSKNGIWDADGIGFLQHILQKHIKIDCDLSLRLLKKLSKKEKYSFWYFYFDGPHPKNYQDEYNEVYNIINKKDSSMAAIINKSYNKLLSENKCQGY